MFLKNVCFVLLLKYFFAHVSPFFQLQNLRTGLFSHLGIVHPRDETNTEEAEHCLFKCLNRTNKHLSLDH